MNLSRLLHRETFFFFFYANDVALRWLGECAAELESHHLPPQKEPVS